MSWLSFCPILFIIDIIIILILIFREVAEPAITVHNLAAETTELQVMKMFDAYKPVRVEFTPTAIGVEAFVVLGGPGDVELASISFNRCVGPDTHFVLCGS